MLKGRDHTIISYLNFVFNKTSDYLSSVDSNQELTVATLVDVPNNQNAEDGSTQDITATTGASGQHMSGNINEDSIDAVTAIIDEASISPTLDQGDVAGGDSIAAGALTPIVMLIRN